MNVADRLRGAPGIVAIEVNISCPNLEDPIEDVLVRSRTRRERSIRGVTRVASQPVFTKLSPDVTDIVEIARAAVRAGTHGLSVMNTALGMAIDTETFRPKLSTFTGGLSGPAVKPIAIRCVYQVSRAFPEVPIIGQGGIWTGEDVAEFLLAGASAVAVGTANFVEPTASTRILDEFRRVPEPQEDPGRVTAPTHDEGRMSNEASNLPVCVALDVSSLDEAKRLVDLLAERVPVFKVGLQLFTAAGPAAVEAVHAAGREVFLDLKVNDIPKTAIGAVRSAARARRPLPDHPQQRGTSDGAGGG